MLGDELLSYSFPFFFYESKYDMFPHWLLFLKKSGGKRSILDAWAYRRTLASQFLLQKSLGSQLGPMDI
jgi:hypothetical protein